MKTRFWLTAACLSLAALVLIAASKKVSDPEQAARLNNLGCAYMNQQLFEKALKDFEDAARLDPELRRARVNEGIALVNLGRVDAARQALEEAAKADPKDPHVWYALGMLAKNSSQPEPAIADFRRVTEIDDHDSDTWYFLGTVYSQLKQFPQAIDAFEHALRLNPLHASAEFGLSRAYQQSGDTEHAHQHLGRFQYITQNKLGSAMSLAYGEQGKYSLAEESPASARNTPPPIRVRFLDATAQAGLPVGGAGNNASGSDLGPGACFLDYDNDGNIDLFLPDNGARGMALYHNRNGKFEDVTRQAGLDPASHALSCTAGDYDNDGFADLAVVVEGRVVLLHNEKNGTFKDVTLSAGINNSGPAIGVTFIDYDHDGDIDLYVTGAAERAVVAASAIGSSSSPSSTAEGSHDELWRNNGNGTFTNQTEATGLSGKHPGLAAIGTDYNNDRAVDLLLGGDRSIFENPREGKFKAHAFLVANGKEAAVESLPPGIGMAVFDFDHDGWMDIAMTDAGGALSLWRNQQGKSFEPVKLPETNWVFAYGVAAVDYDNDGWVDLVAAGETKDGKGELRLFRNGGVDGFRDVTSEVGLDQIRVQHPRAIITGDYDNDGATDLLVTENHGPAILLRNEGGDHHNWLRLALKGLNDNKSAIGTKVEVFSDGIRQKFEIYGSNGYLGQNSPYLNVGLGEAKQADVIRMLWPTGVLQDEVDVVADRRQAYMELDRRGSSCPTLFVWNGRSYELVADILGAGVVGHWVGPGERNIPRPVEYVKVDPRLIGEKDGQLSFRLIEPMEEVVYLDEVKLLAVDHPANLEVYPNEYFASQPPYPEFKVVTSRDRQPPAAAWDDQGRDLMPDLAAHRYIGGFPLLPFKGFARPHSLTLDLGEPYRGGPLSLLMHGEIEYFTATGMYAAWQAGIEAVAPYVEAEVPSDGHFRWVRITRDMGFPAGLPRTITVDLAGKLPLGSRRIRITTNLQIYWDSILIDRSRPSRDFRLRSVPLTSALLGYHGYPRQIEDQPPGNVKYIYSQVSRTGPYARQAGSYTRYGDVAALLAAFDDKLVVFGSGEEVALEFDARSLPPIQQGWTRDYFFMARGYEKDMDFYAADAQTVAPLPFRDMGTYPYPGKAFPSDDDHTRYLLDYNTRFVSGREPRSYSYDFQPSPDR